MGLKLSSNQANLDVVKLLMDSLGGLKQMGIIYFLVGLLASIIGAIAGLGGGVIIKPVLDTIGHYDVATVGVLAASTVFAMACISLLTSFKSKVKINFKTSLLLSVGSIIGGVIGKTIFNYIVELINDSDTVTVIQAIMLASIMILIYIFVKFRGRMKVYQMESRVVIVLIGIVLGMVAAFLGIGGGPLNVAILAILFSMGVKESALNSIFIIFFSQLSALTTIGFTAGFGAFDLSMLFYMIAGGMIGGFIGSHVADRMSSRFVEKVFLITIVGITLTNIFNIVRYFN